MRTNAALFLAGIAGLSPSNAFEAPVYTFDPISLPSTASHKLSSITPEGARLLLAHRLGLSKYHDLTDADEDTLDLINSLSSNQGLLFQGDEREDEVPKLLVVVEGIENPKDVFDHNISPAFTISNPPPLSSNLQLVSNFLSEDEHRRGLSLCSNVHYNNAFVNGGCSGRGPRETCFKFQTVSGQDVRQKELFAELDDLMPAIRRDLIKNDLQGSSMMLHISTLESIRQKHGPTSKRYSEAYGSIKRILTEILERTRTQESTIVLMPPMSSNMKRSESSYGSHRALGTPLMGLKRQEEPLSMDAVPEASSSSSSLSSNKVQPSQPQTLRASSLPRTTLPICHSSRDLCVTTTNNCSGHGACFRKYTDKDLGAGLDCWSCGCTPTVRNLGEGQTKTTYWGGPACQKKDVSMPFFLLAGFTIAMVATLSWGIGLMYSIGQEDLPSVIGAGVTGPRAQK